MTHPSPTSKEENSALLDDAQAEAVKWNACCAALRAAILKYIKSNFTTATAGKAERELLEVGTLFYKDAGQNLLTHIAALEAEYAECRKLLLSEMAKNACKAEAQLATLLPNARVIEIARAILDEYPKAGAEHNKPDRRKYTTNHLIEMAEALLSGAATAEQRADERIELRRALRQMADAYVRKVKTGLTADEIAKEPWRCAEYIEAERLCRVPLNLHFTEEWLRRKIENDPDLPCEAGATTPAPTAALPVTREKREDETEITHQIRCYSEFVRREQDHGPNRCEIANILSAHAPFINEWFEKAGLLSTRAMPSGWRPQLGDPVRYKRGGKYPEWETGTFFFAGITVNVRGDQQPNVWIAERWPVESSGDITDGFALDEWEPSPPSPDAKDSALAETGEK